MNEFFISALGCNEKILFELAEKRLSLSVELFCVLNPFVAKFSSSNSIETYPEYVNRFVEKSAPEQKTFELIHLHHLENSDIFEMEPGYENFQKIEKGELLAKQNGNDVRSEWGARIFLPLYQSEGNDGFFVMEEVDDE